MKTHPKTLKLIATASFLGISLALSSCAERAARPERGHHRGPAIMSLEQAVKQATTPADHERIAARYERKADKLLNSARYHERLAETYARTDNPKMAADSARHCRAIAQRLKEAAEEMKALAKMHREMKGQ
ncbi:MAG: hypothetical protein N3A55_06675 [Methylohalobius sp.]|nr:hypothetical protein [Methylohalobius sp.]